MAITVDKASPALTVPQDIADLIVDEIRFLDITLRDVSGLPWPPNRLHFHTHRTRTLQAWSTICRAFVHPCQKHMFYSRQYDTYHDYKAQNSFFVDSPHIAALVKKLSIGFPSAEQLDINRRNRFYVFGKSDRNLALFEILRRFPSVQSLTLDGDSYDHGDRQKNWDTIARPLQLSIYHILQLSTLKTLIVSTMLNPPLLFISCLELEELLLFDSTIDTHDIGATHPLPATPNFKIRSLALSGLTYVLPQLLELGITGLSVIRHGSYSSWDDWKFLEASSSSLLHLDISIFTYTAMKFPTINLMDLRHLRSIKIYICHSCVVYGPKGFLLQLLESASTSNVIESISYRVTLFHQVIGWDVICDGVDAILSQPQFCNLQRFTLMVDANCSAQDDRTAENLHPLYAGKLAALNARGILRLEVKYQYH